ncbi:hypothetical protein PQX77_010506 [Marasmius sp. AFHP31]|nr:hypothetical protein PQX77_010506 [Marasmius sp. AFHP31]
MAYLCQSHLISPSEYYLNAVNICLIDYVRFSLIGDFLHDTTKGPTPAYLFVPRFWVDIIDGMFCTYLPPPETLFYWASDPNGSNKISEEDWERYGIPNLHVRVHVGSIWDTPEYDFVRDHLHRKGYGEDGARYARDHGYPELILGDPHDVGRIQELSERMDDVHISPLQPHDQVFPPLTSPFNMPFAPQASNIPPSQTVWSTEEVFNMRKRREIELSSGQDPAKRVRVAPPAPPARLSRRTPGYTSSTRPRSFGGTAFVRLSRQPSLGGFDSSGSARIREWDHRQFEFEASGRWDGNGDTTGIGGNDGQRCDMQWSRGFLG